MPAESAFAIIGITLTLLVVTLVAGVSAAVKKEKEIYGENSEGDVETHTHVKVVAKDRMPHPRDPRVTVNVLIFELENRQRREFAVKDQMTYEKILINDEGELCFRGKQFLSFDRK